MTLGELVVVVDRHRQQMAPLAYRWAGAIEDDAARQLAGLLVVSDRKLDRLCRQLSQHIGQLDQSTVQSAGRNEEDGCEGRSDPRGRRS